MKSSKCCNLFNKFVFFYKIYLIWGPYAKGGYGKFW
jgi:hypothetical protein